MYTVTMAVNEEMWEFHLLISLMLGELILQRVTLTKVHDNRSVIVDLSLRSHCTSVVMFAATIPANPVYNVFSY